MPNMVLGYPENVDKTSFVDLVYSAHSSYQVSDLLERLGKLFTKVRIGGFFFETPNIGDLKIFEAPYHTPHTFLLSVNSFQFLKSRFSVKIIGDECCDSAWKQSSHIISRPKRQTYVGGFKYEVQHVLKTGETLRTEF